MPNAALVIESATTIAHAVEELIGVMQPPVASPARLRVGLYLTIAEQYEAALHLERAGAGTHSAVHVRSMLEGLIAMTLLAKDANYLDQMMFEQLSGEQKMYEGLSRNEGMPISQKLEIESRLSTCKTRYDDLHAKGYRRRPISAEFEKAGLPEFALPYTMLCGFSHNDVAVIAFRHQGETGMQFRAKPDPAVIVSIFSVAVQIMIMATHPLSDLAKFPAGIFDLTFQKMNDAWGRFMADSNQNE